MSDLQHSFLFQEGLWLANGRYYDACGVALPCEGQTRITHAEGLWINEGFMRVLADQPVEFSNRYEIVPFEEGQEITTWHSLNPDLENLHGQFIIVFDAIISPWQSESGEYWGSEFLLQINDTLYHNRGYACRGNTKLSSWAVELTYEPWA